MSAIVDATCLSPRLVLVEGPPGSGESTTAQSLALQLPRAGLPARWFYSGKMPHPVAMCYDGGTPTEALAGRVRDAWGAFDPEPTPILDGNLFLGLLFGLRMQSRSVRESLERACARGAESMQRFYSDRYDSSAHSTSRAASGMDGLAAFWDAHTALIARQAEAWPGRLAAEAWYREVRFDAGELRLAHMRCAMAGP